MSRPSREEYSSTSPVPRIKDNVGSQSHHPFGRVDISEKTKVKEKEQLNNVCVKVGPRVLYPPRETTSMVTK